MTNALVILMTFVSLVPACAFAIWLLRKASRSNFKGVKDELISTSEAMKRLEIDPDLVVCETIFAHKHHLRYLGGKAPNYGGNSNPQILTLCELRVGWDTRIPVLSANCQRCLDTARAHSSPSCGDGCLDE